MKHSKDTKLNFGLYKNYDVGIVYLFDPRYIEWCINSIEDFCIVDLDDLLQYGVYQNANLEGKRNMQGPEEIVGMSIYKTFKEFIENFDNFKSSYEFDSQTLNLNRKKVQQNG